MNIERQLYKAFLSLETESEVANFLRDLMTEQEIETFANRLQGAFLLSKSVSYRKISRQTGLSTATVTRINNWLERGMNGYKTVIKRLTTNSHHRKTNPVVL